MTVAADLDIFSLGRQALGLARAAFEGRAFFTAARRLQSDGTWSGPADAGCALADEEILEARGGLAQVRVAGANTVLVGLDGRTLAEAPSPGLRGLLRVPFEAGEPADERARRLQRISEVLERSATVDGVVPVPVGEAQGLDTLAFFAACRSACGKRPVHVVVDLERFGHKLGQLCLSFGADELLGPIVRQRALRLGERASSNELTRDEATLLLRASGFVPCERLPDGGILPL